MKKKNLNLNSSKLNAIKVLSIGLIACAITLFSCTKRNNSGDDSPPTKEEFFALTNDGFKGKVQSVTFDASNSNYIYTSPLGTKVSIDGTCLRDGSNTVSGQVTLEFFEAYEKKDMIVANKATMGVSSTGDSALLETGGQFYVAVKKDGKTLSTTCGVNIAAKGSNTGGLKSDMSGWDGKIDDNGSVIWAPANRWELLKDSNTYVLNVPEFGWFNCDRFYNDPRPKTEIKVMVPSGYTNNNCAVYLIPKNMPNSLGNIYGANWPIGMGCYILFVTGKDGKYKWVANETTIIANHVETIDLSKAKTGTRSDFVGQVSLLQ